LFEKGLDEKVSDVIRNFSDGKQALIFCSSKKGTEILSLRLSKSIRVTLPDRDSRSFSQISAISDSKLRGAAGLGFGYHHAGVSPDDRSIVEDLFLSGSIQVLCTTSTLAHGVNLPAHLVIVKGTNMWRGNGKGYERIPRSTIMQMTGRAGRPGFDTYGVAVIMTSDEDREFYEVRTTDIVESTLPSCLVEALCAEVTQGVILGLPDAIMWLKMTFFHIRVLKNGSYYNVTVAPGQSAASAMQGICLRYSALFECKITYILTHTSLPHLFLVAPSMIWQMQKSWSTILKHLS
jgi:ATP-dependent DNA helicase HFM1/MER3